jgi:acyl-CoA dehydrogenase
MDPIAALLRETASKLFAREITPSLVLEAEAGVWPASAWAAVEEAGLAGALVSEEQGGAGVPLAEALRLLQVAGGHAVPLPLAETMLAGWLLGAAGLRVPEGPLTVAPVIAGERLMLRRDGGIWHLAGRVSRVPWGRHALAATVLVAHEGVPHVALVPAAGWQAVPGTNLAKEPRDTLEISTRLDQVAPTGLSPGALLAIGAAARAQQIAGALGQLTTATTGYAQDRVQFGRPIGKFQAVQQNLAVLAAQAAAAAAAADMAAEAVADGLRLVPVAAAKARAGEAAGIGAAIAHQVHGAIGFTREHRLHMLTRRLWSWRDEFGNEATWNRQLGAEILAAGADGLWAALTAA